MNRHLFAGVSLVFLCASGAMAAPPPATTVGGYDPVGLLPHVFKTDGAGALYIVGSGSGGIVFGPDAQGQPPSQAPVQEGCIFNTTPPTVTTGQTVRVQCDANGHPVVTISGTVPVSGTFWQATQPVSIAALPALTTGAAVIGAVTQSGTWNVGTITTLPAVAGNTTAADASALTLNMKAFATQGLYNGTTEDIQRSVQGASAGTGIGVAAMATVPTTSANGGITEVVSAAVEGGHIGKASAGNFYRAAITTGATAGFLLIFNSTTVPADGAVTPILCRIAPANSSIEVDHSTMPDVYSTGISAAFSTTGCFTKTASATAMFELAVK